MAVLPELAGFASNSGVLGFDSLRVQLTVLQYYLSGLLGFLIIEMLANWGMLNHTQTLMLDLKEPVRSLLSVFERSWRGYYFNSFPHSRSVYAS